MIAALQLPCDHLNLLTSNIFAALQLNCSGRAALIFVENWVNRKIQPQRGGIIKQISIYKAFNPM